MPHQSWKRLEENYDRLKRNENISDADLIDAATHLQIQTNALHAAYLLVSAIAPICGYRSHLTEALLFEPMLPLIYSGIESADGVIIWLQYQLKQPTPFDGIDALGLDWIRWLTTQPEIIQKYLDQEIAKNDQLMLQETLEWFALHSKIPLERIIFYRSWQNSVLNPLAKIILFFAIPVDDEETEDSIVKFAKLTEILAEYDPDAQLQLKVLNTEGYWDYLNKLDHQDIRSRLPGIDPKNVQILWIVEGKVIHTVSPDEPIDKQIYEKNTLDLIAVSG